MTSEISKTELEDGRVLEHPPITSSDEAAAAATCRICMDSQGDDKDDALISPCMCKGSQQFVHRSCLDRWRSIKEARAFSHCPVCEAQFHLRRVVELKENYAWRKFNFRAFAQDVYSQFWFIQLLIGWIGGTAYLVDIDGFGRNYFNDNVWDCILSRHPIPFYYSIGLTLLLFLSLWLCVLALFHEVMLACVGAVIMFIYLLYTGIADTLHAILMKLQRRYLVNKRELTQEYVVEDLHGCYTPAKLDPKHEERLKNLKLF